MNATVISFKEKQALLSISHGKSHSVLLKAQDSKVLKNKSLFAHLSYSVS